MSAVGEVKELFADRHLVEQAFAIPPHYKSHWKLGGMDTSRLWSGDEISEVFDTPAYLLKNAFEDQFPHDVLYRQKKGFPVALNNRFGGRLRDYAEDMRLGDRSAEGGLYTVRGLKKTLTGYALSENHALPVKAWMFFNLDLFSGSSIDTVSSARSV